MGVSLTWVAVKGLALDEVLSRLELARTGATCNYPVDGVACHPLAGDGWLVIANRCDHRIGDDAGMASLSAGCEALVCHVEEHVAFARCAVWRDGGQSWQVTHEGSEDEEDISWEGEPPARFHALLEGVRVDNDYDNDEDPDAWFHMDIPLILASEIAGYRHDADDPAFDAQPFEALRDLRPGKPWWRRLFR